MEVVKDPQLALKVVAKLETDAGRLWDAFYRCNADRFFKERHWFAAEFPALLGAATVLEVGCGTGASAFPLLELNPAATVYACDFAPTAVALVQRNPLYALSRRMTAFVADITADDLTAWVPPAAVDACTMVFVLSAISPGAMPAALANVAATLRPGTGRLFFRDYASGDVAEARLRAEGRRQRIADGFYARGDGTRAYYFTEAFARLLFEGAGFRCERLEVLEREVENKKRGVRMGRRFLQAEFVFGGRCAPAAAAAESGARGAPAAAAPPNAGVEQAAERGPLAQQETDVALALGQWTLRLRAPAPCPASGSAAVGLQRSAGARLARLVLGCPSLFLDKSVVELGCGGAALPSLAALRWARRVVATDPDPGALRLLRLNAAANGHLVVIERLRAQALEWGSAQHAQRVLAASPAGFDVVLAADPLGRAAAGSGSDGVLGGLFSSAASFLGPRPGAVMLIGRNAAGAGAGRAEWAAAAGRNGLHEVGLPHGAAVGEKHWEVLAFSRRCQST